MSTPGRQWHERLAQALDGVRHARQAPPTQGKQAFRQAMLQATQVRNELLRAAPDAGAPSLQQLNALLSVMASVEFPLGGYHAERMDLIERELHKLGTAEPECA